MNLQRRSGQRRRSRQNYCQKTAHTGYMNMTEPCFMVRFPKKNPLRRGSSIKRTTYMQGKKDITGSFCAGMERSVL